MHNYMGHAQDANAPGIWQGLASMANVNASQEINDATIRLTTTWGELIHCCCAAADHFEQQEEQSRAARLCDHQPRLTREELTHVRIQPGSDSGPRSHSVDVTRGLLEDIRHQALNALTSVREELQGAGGISFEESQLMVNRASTAANRH